MPRVYDLLKMKKECDELLSSLTASPRKDVQTELEQALEDDDAASLARLCALCVELPIEVTAYPLIRLLHRKAVSDVARDSLCDHLFRDEKASVKAIAAAVERRLTETSDVDELVHIPYLLTEFSEPKNLLILFLQHHQAALVASALESGITCQLRVRTQVKRLVNDKRACISGGMKSSIGRLAKEALDAIA